MPSRFLPAPTDTDHCVHCDSWVGRVWLVPGDLDASCRDCFTRVTGREPRHHQGHTSAPGLDTADLETLFAAR